LQEHVLQVEFLVCVVVVVVVVVGGGGAVVVAELVDRIPCVCVSFFGVELVWLVCWWAAVLDWSVVYVLPT
jgi:hypothetical protein